MYAAPYSYVYDHNQFIKNLNTEFVDCRTT